ncbi:MAG: Sulfoxide reductase catalytic subunit yedY, partial [Gemmatimonadetes bacterium]|nr:Sulfoxide reductase catalytic subunit yedY [Gemmatimonadota bacterium]
MLIHRPGRISSSDVTDESLYWSRREWLAAAGLGVASLLPGVPGPRTWATQDDLKPNPWDDVTGYNNFYEFGTGKEDPKANAGTLRPRPWSVKVEGEVKGTG